LYELLILVKLNTNMKISELKAYRCPKCTSKLTVLKSNKIKKNDIISGILIDDNGHKFFIK